MSIAYSEEKLQNILTIATIESVKKTKCMVISKQSGILVCNFLLCKVERIKQGTFKYLGFTITPEARCCTEIKKRKALSEDKFTKMKSIFTNRNIRIYTQINTQKALWFISLHGCECWTRTKDLEGRLEAAEM